MKKILIALMLLALCLGCASAESAELLGNAFPDFTVTDTEGNTFTLSEALKDHDAALINFWASWCPPCEREFPFLNEAYEQYGDRVAFIALSIENTDTLEKIEAYRQAHGLSLPMGRDEGTALYQLLQSEYVPITVIVDRFGNAAFMHVGAFMSADDVFLVLKAFLGDGYTETAVLTEIPQDTSTAAFPVSAGRAIRVENESARSLLFYAEGYDEPIQAYVMDESEARLRLEIPASDIPGDMVYYNLDQVLVLPSLLNAEGNAFAFRQPLPGPDEETPFAYASLQSLTDEDIVEIFLISGEQNIEKAADAFQSWGYNITWEYGEFLPAPDAPQAYILHIVDQDNEPVAEVSVNFCTDTACVPRESDENGLITFTGVPDAYHVQLVDVPEGYSYDEDFELYTKSTYGEWVLRVKKD